MEGLTPFCSLGKGDGNVQALKCPGADQDCEEVAKKDVQCSTSAWRWLELVGVG